MGETTMLSLRSDSRTAQWLRLLVLLVFVRLEMHATTPLSKSAESTELAVGAARVDLSPRAPVRLMGYAARAHSPPRPMWPNVCTRAHWPWERAPRLV